MNYDEASKSKDECEHEAVELGHQLIICDALRRDKIIGICESIRGLEKADILLLPEQCIGLARIC